MEIHDTEIINLQTNPEQTPVSNFRAVKGKIQGFHIIYNMHAFSYQPDH